MPAVLASQSCANTASARAKHGGGPLQCGAGRDSSGAGPATSGWPRQSQRRPRSRQAALVWGAARTTGSAAVAVGRASVSESLAKLRQQDKVAFIPYVTAGDPDLATTAEVLVRLEEAGAAVIELGVPYSEPAADGPIIRSASSRALKGGTTLDGVLKMLHGVSHRLRAPVVLLSYCRPVMARGPDAFCADARDAGASGLLVPDAPPEETRAIRQAAEAAGLELVLLTRATTPLADARRIAAASQGFVYLASTGGVTGPRARMDARVEGLISSLRKATDKAVCIGFGVSSPNQARELKSWGAHGVIVGSPVVRALGEAPSKEEGLEAVSQLASSFTAVL